MRHATTLLAILALSAPTAAFAQFVPPEDDGYTPPPPPATTTAFDSPTPTRSAPAAAPAPAADAATVPSGFSFGVGAGWLFPGGDLMNPNTAASRFRVTKQLEIEANLGLGGTSSSKEVDIGVDNTDFDTLDLVDGSIVNFGADVRYSLAQSATAEWVIGAGGEFSFNASDIDPDGPNNKTTVTELSYGLQWLIGVNVFFTKHLALSADVRSALFNYSAVQSDTLATETLTTDTDVVFGLFMNPSARVLLMAYF